MVAPARVASRPVTVAWFAGGAISLALLSVRLPGPLLYAVVLLAGCFVFAAQVLVYAYIGRVYSAENRATGLGWAPTISAPDAPSPESAERTDSPAPEPVLVVRTGLRP